MDLFKRSLDKPGQYSAFKMQDIDIDVFASKPGC